VKKDVAKNIRSITTTQRNEKAADYAGGLKVFASKGVNGAIINMIFHSET
jgi:hypothetical protein